MKSITALLLLLFVLCFMPALAQDGTLYEDPVGRFSVPIPPSWTDQSTSEVVRFGSSDDLSVAIRAAEAADAEAGDQAVLKALMPDLAGTVPVQTTSQPGLNGNWTAKIFAMASGRLVVLATQWIKGVTYALLFDLPNQDAIAVHQDELLLMFNEFSVGKPLDLSGVTAKLLTPQMLADLKVFVEDARQRFHVPGVSLAIVQDGAVIYKDGFGTTEANGGQPVTPDTLFLIGSTTKSMTTMMIGTLVDEGVLDWNQPVTDILSSFALSDPSATSKIRLRDLLNMSSGVASYDIVLSAAQFTPPELVSSLTDIPMVAAPGMTWNYNNQMVTTGGYLSALATGVSMDKLYEGYVNLMQQRVFDPIGMTQSTFDFDAASANPNHALPYIFDPLVQKIYCCAITGRALHHKCGACWRGLVEHR